MDYYERKRNALMDIDKWLSEGMSQNLIIYKLSTKYGYGKKQLDERIKQIKEVQSEGVEKIEEKKIDKEKK